MNFSNQDGEENEAIRHTAERELFEETGITAISLEEIGRYISHDTIYYQFLCITDCGKTTVSLQEGETVAYRWLTENEYIAFVNSVHIKTPSVIIISNSVKYILE